MKRVGTGMGNCLSPLESNSSCNGEGSLEQFPKRPTEIHQLRRCARELEIVVQEVCRCAQLVNIFFL